MNSLKQERVPFEDTLSLYRIIKRIVEAIFLLYTFGVSLKEKLARCLRRKFKKLRHGYMGRARYTLTLRVRKNPNLFAHWTFGYRLYTKNAN